MEPPKISDAATIHQNPFSKVLHVEADFGSFTKQYYVTYFGPRAGVVVVRQGKLLLVRQYRFLVKRLTLEIPGGTVEHGESPSAAIRRECLEETGVTCKKLKPLVEYYPGLDNVDNQTTIFYCEDVGEQRAFRPDSQEVIEVLWMPIKECLGRIYRGELVDALTIIGVLAYHAKCMKKEPSCTTE